ncbi:MAG: hypothetical protein IPP71_05870 [Bacteroidetes bacterium]|nr:hypothetical protein [Bacteroidota bacterium]
MKVAYLDGTSIQIASMNHFSSLLQTNKISEDTLIFNNLVANLDEFKSSWKTPIKNSWLASLI